MYDTTFHGVSICTSKTNLTCLDQEWQEKQILWEERQTKRPNFTQFNFAQTHIDGTGQEKIIGTGMVRESKSNFIGTGSRTYPVPIGQTLRVGLGTDQG